MKHFLSILAGWILALCATPAAGASIPSTHLDLQAARMAPGLGQGTGEQDARGESAEDSRLTNPDELRAALAGAQRARASGDHAQARELIASAIERALPVLAAHKEPAHLCLCALGNFAHEIGELRLAERFRRAVLEMSDRTLPWDHPELLRARVNLANTVKRLGDLAVARDLERAILETRERTLAPDHPDLQVARTNLAWTIMVLGDLADARVIFEQVLEVQHRTLAPDHPDIQATRLYLAWTVGALGDLAGKRELEATVLEVRTRTLAADHPDLQETRLSLAETVRELGDITGARALQEQVLEVFERSLPADHPSIHRARGNLAATLHMFGDHAAARRLQESVLEFLERTMPGDHPEVLMARGRLAITMQALGDLAGARALNEAVLEARERTLPADHADIQRTRVNLSAVLVQLGDLAGARRLLADVLDVWERTLPSDHPDLQRARVNLAAVLLRLGEYAGVQRPLERVLEVWGSTLPADHPDLQRALVNLAASKSGLGDLLGARVLFENALGAFARTHPGDHPELQNARGSLALTSAQLAASAARRGENGADGERGWHRALALAGEGAAGAVIAARTALWSAAVREAEERVARAVEQPLAHALSFAAGLGEFERSGTLFARAFELSESTRATGLAGAALARAPIGKAERERLGAGIRAAGEELARLAQRGATPEDYHLARGRRESAERELLALARSHAREGLGALEFDAHRLAAHLGSERALVGFRSYRRSWLEETESPEQPETAHFELRGCDSLGAFVLCFMEGRAQLEFVDLGPVAEVQPLVVEWREAVLASPDRGLGLATSAGDSALTIGRRLRAAVWDPLAHHLGDARRVVVALDDVLHLVPLDALPLDDGELVGERWCIETRVALWELLDAPRPTSERHALVSLGGASFNSASIGLATADLAALEPADDDQEPVAGQPIALLRGGAWERGFAPLSYTRLEARGLAELFEEAFEDRYEGDVPALVLERSRASREALVEAAPRARFLHVATHGWFAPESVRSWADGDDSAQAGGFTQRLGGAETVRGMSPMLLCGLALAGANLAPDSLGRVPGLVTAEELSTLDLTGCELAVLSACDTNVGERRAGQGVASLQKALHMAGARSVITSLWKVPDEATSELMLDFYRRLWVERKPKHQALWEAKQKLRNARDEAGRPLYTTRDWAAWVLTGDPD